MSKQHTVKRLQRDLEFLRRNPILGCSLEPVEDDLFRWHGNVRAEDDSQVVFHLVVDFPPRYPAAAPRVRVSTPVPHPNVSRSGVVCCPMLGNSEAAAEDQWSGWSAAYSAYSVLLQVSAILREDHYERHNGVTPYEALERAEDHECSCGHTPLQMWPPVAVSLSTERHVLLPAPVLVLPAEEVRDVVVAPQEETQEQVHEAVQVPKQQWRRKHRKKPLPKKKESGWTEVTYKKKKQQPALVHLKQTKHSTLQLSSAPKPTLFLKKKQMPPQVALPVGVESAAARKNRLRRERKRRLKAEAALLAVQKPPPKAQKRKPKAPKPKAEAKAVASSSSIVALGNTKENMGSFAEMPPQVFTYLGKFLSLQDILRMGLTSKGMHSRASAAFLWRDLYAREFPNSIPSGMMDFRHAYELRVQGIVSELNCFYTKRSLHEGATLGYGLTYTRNPRTHQVDYVDVTQELMSAEAFYSLKVREGARGEEVQEFLPLYLTAAHWEAAFPLVRKCVLRMYSDVPFHVGAVNLLCAALNTRTVLLADKGVAASFVALASYSQLQRLLVALCQTQHSVQREVDSRVSHFCASEANREKSECRSLGDFIPLMLATKAASWPQVRPMLLREVFARNTLWACRHESRLANLNSGLSTMERLEATWEGGRVSHKLLMLQALFLTMARRDHSLAHTTRSQDRLYGNPSARQLRQVKPSVEAILSPEAGWPLYFRVVCGTRPSPAKVEALLRDAVRDSRRKGYHSKRTNFQAVGASGVSKILRKGESYTTAKDVNEVMLALGWSFPGDTIFLDASCLIYRGARHLGTIDFQTCYEEAGDSIMHSGDQIERETKSGKHNIRVRLREVPKEVDALYLVLSAWTRNMAAVRNPWIRLQDSSGVDLCEFNVESAGTSQAVVMAKLERSRLSGWKVVPIGVTSSGNAARYAPILETIDNINRVGREQ